MVEDKLIINQLLNLAAKKHNEGELDSAEILYKEILEKEPDNFNALNLLGAIDYQLGRYEEAVKKITKAIRINSGSAICHYNLAMSYDALNNEEKAVKNFKKVLEINPLYKNTHFVYYNLGIYFKNKGEFGKALEYYDKAIEFDKDFYDARWNRSLVLLLLGEFEIGWEDYDCRFKKKSPTDSRIFNKPQWDGSLLKNKKILVILEQGFGDNIQFIRYLPFIKEKKGYIILECKKELKTLFENNFKIDEIIEKQDNSSQNFDFYIHLMSIPKIFKTNLNNVPNKVPYLKADINLVEKFKLKLNTDKFKIGIVWAGNSKHSNDKNRSINFKEFKFLKEFPEVEIYSLQKEKNPEKLDDFKLIDFSENIRDFSDTAAIIENLDLIISVDTSVAHLAGAMNKPVWILLPFIPDWRWFFKRDDCPWYPSMRLFRQKKSGNWKDVFEEVKEELKNILERR